MVYHSFDAAGTRAYKEAFALLQKEIESNTVSISHGESILDYLEAKKFIWGQSDGN